MKLYSLFVEFCSISWFFLVLSFILSLLLQINAWTCNWNCYFYVQLKYRCRSDGAPTSEVRRLRKRSISITPEIGDDIVRLMSGWYANYSFRLLNFFDVIVQGFHITVFYTLCGLVLIKSLELTYRYPYL